ncbi:MAG: alpha/beta hydrolase [Alphaproteobacteria bacterium]
MRKPKDIADDLMAQLERLKPRPDQVETIHYNIRRLTNQFDSPGPEMEHITNFNIPNGDFPVPVRLYQPYGATKEPGPTLIYIHGGGFVTCSIDSHEGICLRIASGSGYRVLSVDYRLAPQYPYPAGPDDCEAVVKWVLDGYGADHGIDRQRLALGGDSAGGNMTAYLVQKYRKEFKAQVLYYPVMQLVDVKPPKAGPQDMLQLGVMALRFIEEHYVAGADTKETRLSPIYERNLKGIPPTLVLTCELDPLRMEGKAYGDNLSATGVKVTYMHEKRMPHGFLNFTRAFPQAKKVPLDTADFLRKYLET